MPSLAAPQFNYEQLPREGIGLDTEQQDVFRNILDNYQTGEFEAHVDAIVEEEKEGIIVGFERLLERHEEVVHITGEHNIEFAAELVKGALHSGDEKLQEEAEELLEIEPLKLFLEVEDRAEADAELPETTDYARPERSVDQSEPYDVSSGMKLLESLQARDEQLAKKAARRQKVEKLTEPVVGLFVDRVESKLIPVAELLRQRNSKKYGEIALSGPDTFLAVKEAVLEEYGPKDPLVKEVPMFSDDPRNLMTHINAALEASMAGVEAHSYTYKGKDATRITKALQSAEVKANRLENQGKEVPIQLSAARHLLGRIATEGTVPSLEPQPSRKVKSLPAKKPVQHGHQAAA